ncbi:polynucleotide adenylyltransferase PcnB [Methylotuvimicrobium sp. KM1]|uniref:polynucleotide adenylyltransferase PcnB n=1 Tax=Methylotuvimicrobium sp. KM1 TaxID=3377707 RepID=UPI00384EBD58
MLNFFKKIISSSTGTPLIPAKDDSVSQPEAPRIYSRSEHNISRSQISENALKVLYRLKKSGFEAYLVGGCVRDLLLGREPKDFDVVTDAHPEQVRKIFRNCRLVGRRFRLAHVHFGREIIEVATFRGNAGEVPDDDLLLNDEGRLVRDNIYGTIEEDVWRRDFTVNSLYYNIRDFSVTDYVGGMADHTTGTLRLIGDPETRYREDPVRMLRAIRFAVKLGFTLHPNCEKPIAGLAELLYHIPPARLFDEAIKLFLSGHALQTFEMLRHYGLFQILFPAVERSLSVEEQGFPRLFLVRALENSDSRVAEGKTVTAYFLFAAFLWDAVKTHAEEQIEKGVPENIAFQVAANELIAEQVKRVSLPRQISLAMREVWSLQPRFARRRGSKPYRLLNHPRFRAAYDFLLLRIETEGVDPELGEWWTQFQAAGEAEQKKMTQLAQKSNRKPLKRRRSRPNKPSNADTAKD